MKIEISIHADAPHEFAHALSGFPLAHLGTAIPQVSFSSAAVTEVRELGDKKHISQKQLERELTMLGPGWRLETRQEMYALVDLEHKNSRGAYTRDESLDPEPYWTADKHPAGPAARVVVWFGGGYVSFVYDGYRARARAVRVAGQ